MDESLEKALLEMEAHDQALRAELTAAGELNLTYHPRLSPSNCNNSNLALRNLNATSSNRACAEPRLSSAWFSFRVIKLTLPTKAVGLLPTTLQYKIEIKYV